MYGALFPAALLFFIWRTIARFLCAFRACGYMRVRFGKVAFGKRLYAAGEVYIHHEGIAGDYLPVFTERT